MAKNRILSVVCENGKEYKIWVSKLTRVIAVQPKNQQLEFFQSKQDIYERFPDLAELPLLLKDL